MKLKTFTAALLASAASFAATLPAQAQDAGTVSLVLGVSGSPFYQALQCGAMARAEELGLDLSVSAGDQFAADSQIPVVNAVTAAAPDVAAIVPTDMQALVQPMRELAERGTKVITIDQTVADNSFVETEVLTDNEAGGMMAAEVMAEILGGEGKVLVITQPPGSLAQDARTAGFEAKLAEFEGIEYIGAQYQSDDPQKAAEIVTSTLSAHPDLAGIFSTNDQGAIGAITGLRQAGAVGRVKMVAYDAASAEVAALKNGAIQALIAQNPAEEGRVAMDAALALINGETLDKTTMTDLVVIREGENDKADEYEYIANCM
ncbi:MAG: ABC transporter substrate-binding protein [Pseudomonadota bacterium]|nr:ABC transporter substrate-binding protein [Pseudomonadota bacterium]